MANTNPVLGVVIIARHGDRAGFYQSPVTYTATATSITTLGEQQEYQLGTMLRGVYANTTSPNYVVGLNTSLLLSSQYTSFADGGGEGGVIFDSAIALWQGFYPPTASNVGGALANGTVVQSPLGGYQYVQIDALLPANDVTLEGWTSCNTWTNNTAAFYASSLFAAKAASSQAFLTSLSTAGLIGDRVVELSNMWNIFDFMNVQSIHNATYAALLAKSGASTLAQARDLANWHEYYTFTSPTLGGIGNIGGQAILPQILASLQTFTNTSQPVKVSHLQIAYKPYLALFNMTNLAAATNPVFPNPQAVVDYASVATLEVRANMAGNGHDVRFAFRNGSDIGSPIAYPLFGSSSIDYDLAAFISTLSPAILPNTTSWCNACAQPTLRGCSAALSLQSAVAANSTTTTTTVHKVSRVGAGFIGAGVTLAIGAAVLGLLMLLGLVNFRRRGRQSKDVRLNKTRVQIAGGGESFVSSIGH